MSRHNYMLLPLILLLLVRFPLEARGAEQAGNDAVQVKADTLAYDQQSDAYLATGNVEIRWNKATLTADSATIRQRENEAEAEGSVVLRRNGDVLRSDRITVNYDTEQGVVENGDLFSSAKNFHLRGLRLLKTGEADYHLERGAFTTCDGPSPSWQFTATDLDVSIDGYAVGKNALFYIGPLPVFYTPYILFPILRERQSGFLFPRVGTSEKKGFNLDIPYYWAFSPSQDVTFDLDVETKRGVGAGIDYRYLGHGDSRGAIRGFYIYDTNREMSRGDLAVRQLQALTPTFTLTSDLHLTLDRDFYRDFGEASGDYNRQLLDSSLAVGKRWQGAAATAEIRYVEDLDAVNNRATLQRLPTLTASLVGRRLGPLPLYAAIDAEYTHFQRDIGIAGERVDLHPTLTLYNPYPDYIQASFWGGYRQRIYDAYGGTAANGYREVGNADAGATLSTPFARVYDVGWGDLRRMKHTLVPQLDYNYVQSRGQDDLPLFDYDDRVIGGSLLTWSLTSHLTGKLQRDDAVPEYRDLLSLRLSQGYQLSGFRRDLLLLVDERRTLTDMRLEARFTPFKRFTVSADSRYDTYNNRFRTATVAADVSDGGGNAIGAGYRNIRGGVDQDGTLREGVEYFEGRLGLDLVKPFVFHYTGRYSFEKGNFLESFYSLEYKRQCWSVTISYRDRADNREFLVSFNLMGIGALGQVKAF